MPEVVFFPTGAHIGGGMDADRHQKRDTAKLVRENWYTDKMVRQYRNIPNRYWYEMLQAESGSPKVTQFLGFGSRPSDLNPLLQIISGFEFVLGMYALH